jgi:hypothetical protein
MKTFAISFISSVCVIAALSCPQTSRAQTVFQTTFNIPEWIQTPGLSDSDGQLAPAGDGITGNGGWTTSNGSRDQITAAANNPAGGGGRGFRHWVGNGLNNAGGGIVINFTPSTQVWIRYYIRHKAGFAWAPGGQNMKTIYCNRNIPGTFYFGYFFGAIGGHVEQDSGTGNHIADFLNSSPPELIQQMTWANWQGGSTGDGNFHVLEVRAKMNTTGASSNGVFEFWVDDTKIYSNSNVHFANTTGARFTNCAVGENHNAPQNGADAYVDFDDIAISTTGYIGPIGATGTPVPQNLRVQ